MLPVPVTSSPVATPNTNAMRKAAIGVIEVKNQRRWCFESENCFEGAMAAAEFLCVVIEVIFPDLGDITPLLSKMLL